MARNGNNPDERDRHIDGIPGDQEDLDEGMTDPTDVEELSDGSAIVKFSDSSEQNDDDEGSEASPDFLENLAETVDQDWLNALAIEYLDKFDKDKDARKKRDEDYADGIKRTGLGKDAPGGADFEGASRAVHPVLLEGCIEFAARSMKELMPPSGPVKTLIIGEQTDAKVEKAERKKTYMNWQLTSQIKEFRANLEQTLTQVPLGGSQFLKIWHDDRFRRPKTEFVPVDYILLPFAAPDFENAQRKTHVQDITKQDYQARIDSGLYRAPPHGTDNASSEVPEQTAADKASDKVEGKEDTSFNEDGVRRVFECYCQLEVPDDKLSKGQPRGYILTVDETTRTVSALYRNWDEHDENPMPEALDWIVEFGFIPWRGAYKIGLAHIIGGLSGALTGALRSILDGGFLSSHAGGLLLKGSRQAGKNVSSSPTEFTEVSAPPNVDDIRKLAMPFPFPGPSETIFKLMDWLTVQAKGVVSTASEAIKDAGSDMPVGTALALIEQGSITFSAVHARLHASMRKVLSILHRIDGQFLDDKVTVKELGELVVGRADFQGPMDVIPVSDPNIFSDAQRYAQNQAAIALAEKFPMVFKPDKLVMRSLKLMNYPDPGEVLNAPEPAKQLDSLTENVKASDNDVELKAYKSQDHLTHIQSHIHFMSSPIFCANPMMAIPALPKLIAHVKEHLLMMYAEHVKAAMQSTEAIVKAGGPPAGNPVNTGSAFADQQLAKDLGPLMPLLQAAMQMAQQFAPKPPMDPRAQAQIEVAKVKSEADAAEGDKDRQLKQGETQGKLQLEGGKIQAGAQQAQQAEAAESARSTQEMQVAAHNADLAAQSELMDRNLQLALEHMRQNGDNMRSDMTNQMTLLLAEIAQGREDDAAAAARDHELMMQRTDAVFELFSQYMDHKANLGEPVKQTILGAAAQYASQPAPSDAPLALSGPPPAAPMPAPQGFATGGSVQAAARPPVKWHIKRDKHGEMEYIEEVKE